MAAVGKCMTMCPQKEFIFRKKHNLLHRLESAATSQNNLLATCVKEFRRSAAGETVCEPEDLRPSHVLIQTIEYLFMNIASKTDVLFVIIYNFIFDRLRSVRQDAVIQQLEVKDKSCQIKILEKCVRFYIYAAYKVKLDPNLNIDIHINTNHIRDCMQSLLELYSLTSYKVPQGMIAQSDCLATVAAHLLLNVNSPGVMLSVLHNVPKYLRTQAPLSTAIAMWFAYAHNNIIRFNALTQKLLESDSFTVIMMLATIIDKVRSGLIETLCHSHHSKAGGFGAQDLQKWLLLREKGDVLLYCSKFGLSASNNNVKFLKTDFHPYTMQGNVNGCYIVEALCNLQGKRLSMYLTS